MIHLLLTCAIVTYGRVMEPVIGFLYLKGCTSKEAFDEMRSVYGESAPSYVVVKHWHGHFKCGPTSVEPGRPQSAIYGAMCTIQQVGAAILDHRRVTVRQLSHEVSLGSAEKFIHYHLHMGKVSARWIQQYIFTEVRTGRVC